MLAEEHIIKTLRKKAQEILPREAHVWLYGSHARGDAHQDSDWDLLILLPKSSITSQDEDEVAYPLVLEGWKNRIVLPSVLKYLPSMNGKAVRSRHTIRMWNETNC